MRFCALALCVLVGCKGKVGFKTGLSRQAAPTGTTGTTGDTGLYTTPPHELWPQDPGYPGVPIDPVGHSMYGTASLNEVSQFFELSCQQAAEQSLTLYFGDTQWILTSVDWVQCWDDPALNVEGVDHFDTLEFQALGKVGAKTDLGLYGVLTDAGPSGTDDAKFVVDDGDQVLLFEGLVISGDQLAR